MFVQVTQKSKVSCAKNTQETQCMINLTWHYMTHYHLHTATTPVFPQHIRMSAVTKYMCRVITAIAYLFSKRSVSHHTFIDLYFSLSLSIKISSLSLITTLSLSPSSPPSLSPSLSLVSLFAFACLPSYCSLLLPSPCIPLLCLLPPGNLFREVLFSVAFVCWFFVDHYYTFFL